MGKNRFVVNPFGHLVLMDSDRVKLKEFAYNFFDASVLKYEAFIGNGGPKVDPKDWKLIKTKEDTPVYMERDSHIAFRVSLGPPGAADDGPTLEAMRIKASYAEDMSGGAVLAVLEESTAEDPFRSMTIKWSELDLPFNNTLVKALVIPSMAAGYLTRPASTRTAASEKISWLLGKRYEVV